MHSSIYTNKMFISIGIKITVHTDEYLKTLFLLLKYMQLLPKHSKFFGVTTNYPIYIFPFTDSRYLF